MRSCKPDPFGADVVHVREDGRDGADVSGRFGFPCRWVKLFDKNLVHAIIGGKGPDRGPGEWNMLTFGQGPYSSTYNSPVMRRPPDPQLLGFLEAYDRHISDLALALREIVLEEAPDASESVYQVYAVAIWFGFSGKMKDMFCYIATSAKHVNLGFPRGTSLADPNRVLEGDGKTMRHIKFASLADVERPFVRRYIQAAMELAAPAGARGSGKSVVRPAKKLTARH